MVAPSGVGYRSESKHDGELKQQHTDGIEHGLKQLNTFSNTDPEKMH